MKNTVTKYIGNLKLRHKPSKEFDAYNQQVVMWSRAVSKKFFSKIKSGEIFWNSPRKIADIPFLSGQKKGYVLLSDDTETEGWSEIKIAKSSSRGYVKHNSEKQQDERFTRGMKPAALRKSKDWFQEIFKDCQNESLACKIIENIGDRYAGYSQRNKKLPKSPIQIKKQNFNYKSGIEYDVDNNIIFVPHHKKAGNQITRIPLKVLDKFSVLNNKQIWLDQNQDKLKKARNDDRDHPWKLDSGAVCHKKYNLFIFTVQKEYENAYNPKKFIAADINMAKDVWLTFSEPVNGKLIYSTPAHITELMKEVENLQKKIKSTLDISPNERAKNNATTSHRKKIRVKWASTHKKLEKAIRKYFKEEIFTQEFIQYCKDNQMGYAHDDIATGAQTGTFGQDKIKKIVFEIFKDHKIPITKVNPRFTSQKCVKCEHTDKKNRNKDDFKCQKCGFEANVHEMAAVNISRKAYDDYLNNLCCKF